MTDELAFEICSSLLFIRDAERLYKGALARHIAEHGAIEHDGYRFSLRKHKPGGPPSARKAWREAALMTCWATGRDLSITRIRSSEEAA